MDLISQWARNWLDKSSGQLLNVLVETSDDTTHLCGSVNMLEGRDTIHSNLDRLERCACVNLWKFKKAKCEMILHLNQGNLKHKYCLGRDRLRAALKIMI